MLASSIPNKFPIPFGNSAGGGFIRAIPTPSQVGITNGAASLTDGFPPLTFTAVAAGGTPPFGQDFNGILNQVTAWLRWHEAGGPVVWDNTFSTSIGGYPSGSVVQSATTPGLFWFSSADNNTNNPDSGGANWTALGAAGPTIRNARIVTTSTPFTMAATDYLVGLKRTSGIAAFTVTLPTAVSNQEFAIQDLAGNFSTAPVTVNPPGGQVIASLSSFVLNVDRMTAVFHYYGNGTDWGVDA
jgi:hypothetical protein